MPASSITQAYVIGLRVAGMPTNDIASLTGLNPGAIGMIYQRAKKRGFDPTKKPHHIETHLVSARGTSESPNKKSSKKRKATASKTKLKDNAGDDGVDSAPEDSMVFRFEAGNDLHEDSSPVNPEFDNDLKANTSDARDYEV